MKNAYEVTFVVECGADSVDELRKHLAQSVCNEFNVEAVYGVELEKIED